MKNTKPKTIFIVDDDEVHSSLMEDYLMSKTQHKILKFSTGEACLKELHIEPTVIILDYYLNNVNKDAANGIEILKSIKKNYPKIHVIMLSAQERYGVAMQTIKKGAEQYVIKDETSFDKILMMINEMN